MILDPIGQNVDQAHHESDHGLGLVVLLDEGQIESARQGIAGRIGQRIVINSQKLVQMRSPHFRRGRLGQKVLQIASRRTANDLLEVQQLAQQLSALAAESHVQTVEIAVKKNRVFNRTSKRSKYFGHIFKVEFVQFFYGDVRRNFDAFDFFLNNRFNRFNREIHAVGEKRPA